MRRRYKISLGVTAGLVVLFAVGTAAGVIPAIRVNGVQITSLSTDPVAATKQGVWVDNSATPRLRYDDGTNSDVVAEGPVTTKGDLLGFDGTYFNRLAVGTNNYVLTADSAQTNGIKWAAVGACATCITGSPSATGDLLYSTSGMQATTPLADVAAGSYLRSGGVASAPMWSTLVLPNTATTGDVLYATSSNTIGNLADVTAGSFLRSGGSSTAPAWSVTTWPNAATAGDLIIATAGNAIGRLADVATNQVLLSGGVGVAPSWGTVPSAALTSTITAGSCTSCNLTYNAAGQITVAANGSGGSTLHAAYAAGAAQSDSTVNLDSTRLGVLVKNNATPINATLLGVQTSGGTKIFDVPDNGAGLPLLLVGQETDGASAVGIALDTLNSFSTNGDKIVSLRTGGTEKQYWGKTANGLVWEGINSSNDWEADTSDGTGRIIASTSNGPGFQYGANSYYRHTTNGGSIQGGGTDAAGNQALSINTNTTMTGAGTCALKISEGSANGNHYYTCTSGGGINSVYSDAEDITADTSGTAVNKVACWTAAGKVSTCSSSNNLSSIAGIALTTTSSGNQARIARRGRALVNCDSASAVGILVGTSLTTSGSVQSSTTPGAGSIVGRATETCGNTSPGQVVIDIILG